MKKYGPWTILKSTEIYADPWIRLDKDDVLRPDGNPGTYSVVTLKPGVTVLALDGEGYVHLTREFHYAVGRITIEAVSGGIDEGESADVAAIRELAEELGLTAKKWTSLGKVDPFTGGVLSPTTLYLAEDLDEGVANQECTETIEHVKFPLQVAYEMAERGEITHAPSVICLLRAWILRRSA